MSARALQPRNRLYNSSLEERNQLEKYSTSIRRFLVGVTTDVLRMRLRQAAESRNVTLSLFLHENQTTIITALCAKHMKGKIADVFPRNGLTPDLRRWNAAVFVVVLRTSNCLNITEQDDVICIEKSYKRYGKLKGSRGFVSRRAVRSKRDWVTLCCAVQRLVENVGDARLIKNVRNVICKIEMDSKTQNANDEMQLQLKQMVKEMIGDRSKSKEKFDLKNGKDVRMLMSGVSKFRRDYETVAKAYAPSPEPRAKTFHSLPKNAWSTSINNTQNRSTNARNKSAMALILNKSLPATNTVGKNRTRRQLITRSPSGVTRKVPSRPTSAKSEPVIGVSSKVIPPSRISVKDNSNKREEIHQQKDKDSILSSTNEIRAGSLQAIRSRSLGSRSTSAKLTPKSCFRRPASARSLAVPLNKSPYVEKMRPASARLSGSVITRRTSSASYKRPTSAIIRRSSSVSGKQPDYYINRPRSASVKRQQSVSPDRRPHSARQFSAKDRQTKKSNQTTVNQTKRLRAVTEPVIKIPTGKANGFSDALERVTTARGTIKPNKVAPVMKQEPNKVSAATKEDTKGAKQHDKDIVKDVTKAADEKHTKESDVKAKEREMELIDNQNKAHEDSIKKIVNDVLVHEQVHEAARAPMLMDPKFVDHLFTFLRENRKAKDFLRALNSEPHKTWKLPNGTSVRFSFFHAFIFRHIEGKEKESFHHVIKKILHRMHCSHINEITTARSKTRSATSSRSPRKTPPSTRKGEHTESKQVDSPRKDNRQLSETPRGRSRQYSERLNENSVTTRSTEVAESKCWKCKQKELAMTISVNWRNGSVCKLLLDEGVHFREEHVMAAVRANDIELLKQIIAHLKTGNKWFPKNDDVKAALYVARYHRMKNMEEVLEKEGVQDERMLRRQVCVTCFC